MKISIEHYQMEEAPIQVNMSYENAVLLLRAFDEINVNSDNVESNHIRLALEFYITLKQVVNDHYFD